LVELFELDTTIYPGGSVLRFHAGINGLSAYVTFNGQQYVPLPIEAEGFEWSGSGPLPRPTVRVANVTGLMGAAVREMEDLIGCKLTRRRTFVKYLDAVNFEGGVNPTADPSAEFTKDVFYVNRKASENKFMIEFELASMLDVQGVKLPKRIVAPNVCSWGYRSAECGYVGGPVADKDDNPTTNPELDQCSKRTTGCKLRFTKAALAAQSATAPQGRLEVTFVARAGLPFGNFPGAGLLR
jgi:lambda family phage minor tail protein L